MRLAALGLLLLAGCEATDPRPGPIRAMEPRPNPPLVAPARAATPAEAVRRHPWLGRFWEELTPAQRRRVIARLRRPPHGATPAEAPAAWDVMGLANREALVFGATPPRRQQAGGP